MNEKKLAGARWIQVAGWLTLGLGLIHAVATPLIFPLSPEFLADAEARSSLYMFEMTGAAVLLAGALVVYAVNGWKQGQRWAWVICLMAGIYLLVLGTGAVVAMADNPFAYISLAVAIIEILPVWLYRGYFKS